MDGDPELGPDGGADGGGVPSGMADEVDAGSSRPSSPLRGRKQQRRIARSSHVIAVGIGSPSPPPPVANCAL